MKSRILFARSFGPASVLEFADQDLPPLTDGFARIQNKAAGINPIDARRMTGEFKHSGLPQTFGTEFAGTIVELPRTSGEWAVGDEVLGSGGAFTHATVIDVPLANLVRRPATIDWNAAGSIAGAAQTAMTVLDEIGAVTSLLIHGGSGGVGSILIQVAVGRGVAVVATASTSNQDYLRGLGAVPVVYGPGVVDRIRAVHPQAFDASVDMSGGEEATQASLALVKPEGVIAGISGRPASSPRVRPIWVKRNVGNLGQVVRGVADGHYTWEVSKTFPFERAAEAYAEILNGHTRGKSVLTF